MGLEVSYTLNTSLATALLVAPDRPFPTTRYRSLTDVSMRISAQLQPAPDLPIPTKTGACLSGTGKVLTRFWKCSFSLPVRDRLRPHNLSQQALLTFFHGNTSCTPHQFFSVVFQARLTFGRTISALEWPEAAVSASFKWQKLSPPRNNYSNRLKLLLLGGNLSTLVHLQSTSRFAGKHAGPPLRNDGLLKRSWFFARGKESDRCPISRRRLPRCWAIGPKLGTYEKASRNRFEQTANDMLLLWGALVLLCQCGPLQAERGKNFICAARPALNINGALKKKVCKSPSAGCMRRSLPYICIRRGSGKLFSWVNRDVVAREWS